MNLSNENRLLLLCARPKILENDVAQVKHLISLSINWNNILDSAFSQGIAPFLYNCLKTIQEKRLIPQEAMDQLKKAYHENVARNMYLYAELLRIINAFRDKGVKVIVLKGAALAKIVYKDIGLRSMTDIDLLVKKEDLPYAKEIMSGLGYVPKMRLLSEEWFTKNHYHLPAYIHREKSLIVEIHWHITGKTFNNIDIKKWFERARCTKFDGCQVFTPSPEDMIIHLCLHLYNHGYHSKMIWRELCDISETLNLYRGEIDWMLFQKEVNDCGLHRPVYSILYLAKNFYKTTCLPLQDHRIESAHINLKLLKILKERMFTENDSFSAMPGGLIKSLVVNGTGRKIRLLLPIIFPPREAMIEKHLASSFPRSLYFHYFIRPLKLFVKYGKHLRTLIK
ncbi:MAG: hypothetical protein A2Y81_09575 [Nitrospirae bacterium RBG_13_43_8]|nr:MAG: hypothetical protein A2Y81_09575 [Nitrospirae bacterium RBG_13_43_8]